MNWSWILQIVLAGFHGMDSPIFNEYPFKGRSDLDIACPEEESTNEDDILELFPNKE